MVRRTLRAWGRGKNRTDAIEQAKKNAVRDVLFKGVAAVVVNVVCALW